MVVVMRLVYEDVYYVNSSSSNNSIKKIIALRNTDIASPPYETI